MALSDKTLITYGVEVTTNNRSLDFKIISGGVEKQATLNLGFYSPDDLCVEIARAMKAADSTHTYTAFINAGNPER